MTLKQFESLIDQEKQYCDKSGSDMPPEFVSGFKAGLSQALLLFGMSERITETTVHVMDSASVNALGPMLAESLTKAIRSGQSNHAIADHLRHQ